MLGAFKDFKRSYLHEVHRERKREGEREGGWSRVGRTFLSLLSLFSALLFSQADVCV